MLANRGDDLLACGLAVGTTVYRHIREALDLIAAMAPTLARAIKVARDDASFATAQQP